MAVRKLIGIFGIALLITGCGNSTDPEDRVANQRQVEWYPVPWRGTIVDVALVRPDEAAGPGPHPVIFNLTWGDASIREVMDMVFAYWFEEPPARGYYVVAPQVIGSSLALNAHDLIPAIFDWMDEKVPSYDPGKVALVGASNGGRGVFYSAVEHPDRFGALVGMPGRYEGDGTDLAGLAGKPVLLLVGENDAAWLEASQTTHDYLTASGADVTFDVLDGQGHVLVLGMSAVMDWIDEALGH